MGSIPGVGRVEKKLFFSSVVSFNGVGERLVKFGPGFDSGCRQGQIFHFFNVVVWGNVHR